ncbi:MAG: virulence protein E [Bacteroidales bacterium]|nr:virulence protein E [Bacteroidales bacterium]
MKNQTNNKRTFSFFSSPITNTKPSRDFTLLDAYNYIVGHQASHSTNRLRSIIDKDYAKQFKARNFDYCTFSGTFQYRNDKALIRHSGLLCLDFDHLNNIEEVKKILLQDEYFDTMLMFISPSGDGLKWIIEIDIEEATHKEWFNAISNYLMHTHSLQADKSGKDISRACFLPHDPFCYITPKLLRNEQETI